MHIFKKSEFFYNSNRNFKEISKSKCEIAKGLIYDMDIKVGALGNQATLELRD